MSTKLSPSPTAVPNVTTLDYVKQVSAPIFLAAGMIFIGTGGKGTVEMLKTESQTGAVYSWTVPSVGVKRAKESMFLLPTELLAGIRRYLSLNVSNLAKVLRVERPTVYAWLSGEALPRLGNLERIRKVHFFAREWRKVSSEPVRGMLKIRYSEMPSLLEQLEQENIDEQAVRDTLSALQVALSRVPARKSVVQIAKEKGLQLGKRDFSISSGESIDL